MNINQQQFESARINLSQFVLNYAVGLEAFFGIRHVAVDDAPNDYDSLTAMWNDMFHGDTIGKVCQPFKVWNGESDCTVYTTPAANHAFRFWHDVLHITRKLKFNLEDEIAIGLIQTRVIKAEFGEDSVEAKIMLADTVGQSIYAQMNNGEFPANQVSYVYSLIQAQNNT